MAQREFDLEAYIGNYSGHGRFSRLLFIADHSKELEVDALKLLANELKQTTNTQMYASVVERLGDKMVLDKDWIETTDKRAHQRQEKLEAELNGFKMNLIKDSIRMGHNDLGDFHYQRGDLNSALKSYVRSRDYCNTSVQIINMCMNVIKVSIETEQWSQVANYVTKAETTPDQINKITQSKLRSCAALAQLESKKYKMAANKFLGVTSEIGNTFNDIIAPQDIAIYGGLTALATFDRQELKKKVLEGAEFKNFLELVPEIRELISDFYASRYASCLGNFEKLKNEWMLDIHLREHVNTLYEKIRTKALIQYFSPFTSVSLTAMAEAFNTNLPGLERELSKLIMEGAIQARIDSHNKILYARQTDQRSATYSNALKMGEEYERNTKNMLLRMNLMRYDFVVKPPRRVDEKP